MSRGFTNGCGCVWKLDSSQPHWHIDYCPLHAAAPDLLAALQDGLALAEDEHGSGPLGSDEAVEAFAELARAAIASALGQKGVVR